jgi:hypothetical protein
MTKIIVLAGSREEFEQYLDDHGLTDSQALYGWSPDVMAAIRASGVVETGTFYERKDAWDLRQFALSRVRNDTERHRAWVLAERLLDDVKADPDDDLHVLARQLLRSRELIQVVQPMVKAFAWKHNVGNNQKIAQSVETYLHGE